MWISSREMSRLARLLRRESRERVTPLQAVEGAPGQRLRGGVSDRHLTLVVHRGTSLSSLKTCSNSVSMLKGEGHAGDLLGFGEPVRIWLRAREWPGVRLLFDLLSSCSGLLKHAAPTPAHPPSRR
jgi:hypothetical protein